MNSRAVEIFFSPSFLKLTNNDTTIHWVPKVLCTLPWMGLKTPSLSLQPRASSLIAPRIRSHKYCFFVCLTIINPMLFSMIEIPTDTPQRWAVSASPRTATSLPRCVYANVAAVCILECVLDYYSMYVCIYGSM